MHRHTAFFPFFFLYVVCHFSYAIVINNYLWLEITVRNLRHQLFTGHVSLAEISKENITCGCKFFFYPSVKNFQFHSLNFFFLSKVSGFGCVRNRYTYLYGKGKKNLIFLFTNLRNCIKLDLISRYTTQHPVPRIVAEIRWIRVSLMNWETYLNVKGVSLTCIETSLIQPPPSCLAALNICLISFHCVRSEVLCFSFWFLPHLLQWNLVKVNGFYFLSF